MNDTPPDWFDLAASTLSDPQNQRVWSVIVSVFGDLAQGTGDTLSGGALTRIMMPMGLKPDAIRVALHRLRKDSWIESTRRGRTSMHFLTAFGRAQSAGVTPRIYDRTPDTPKAWHVMIADEATGQSTLDDLLLSADYVSVGRNAALGHGAIPGNCDDLLVLDVTALSVPVWLRTRLCPPDLRAACAQLLADVEYVLALHPNPRTLTPSQIATLRALVVHRWRRVVLRHPNLPADYFPPDWPEATCRARVFELLDLLPRPALDQLEADSA